MWQNFRGCRRAATKLARPGSLRVHFTTVARDTRGKTLVDIQATGTRRAELGADVD